MKKVSLNILLIIGITIILSSCNGQHKIHQSKDTPSNTTLGKIVTELDPTIWSIYQDQQSNYWFGSKNNGVYCYDGKKLTQFTTEDGLVDNDVRGIQEDELGNIFIETIAGVSKFDGQSFQTLPINKNNTSQWVLNADDLWFRIGFDNNGPYRYDGKLLHYLKLPLSPQAAQFYEKRPLANFSPYGIYKIYKDNEGLLWLGTTALGFCRYDGASFQWYYEEQLQTTASGGDFGSRAVLQDHEGFFWFNNTRYRYEMLPNKQKNQLNFQQHKAIPSITEDSEHLYFLSITEDDQGDLWMVTYGEGVWRKTGDKFIHYPIKDGTTDVLLFSSYKDNKGILWLGTHNAGLYRYNGTAFEKFAL